MLEQYFISEYKSVKPFFGQFALSSTAPHNEAAPLQRFFTHHHPMSFNLLPSAQDWRQAHLGRLLGHAMRRFDERVLQLMAQHIEVPLALANLAARDKVSAAHIHITRHLPLEGARLNDLATMAAMSKQAMGDLVTQCEAWGLVQRLPDELDSRAKRIVFTDTGLAWLRGFEQAVAQAEAEFRQEVGADVATVVSLGLEAYANGYR
jgi:DNA-binding MarR family transcriptional regulator